MGKIIRVKKGNEEYDVDESKLQLAIKDGFAPVKEEKLYTVTKGKDEYQVKESKLPEAYADGFKKKSGGKSISNDTPIPSGNGLSNGQADGEIPLVSLEPENTIPEVDVTKNPIDLAADYVRLKDAEKVDYKYNAQTGATTATVTPDDGKTIQKDGHFFKVGGRQQAKDLKEFMSIQHGIQDPEKLYEETKDLTPTDFGAEGFSKEQLLSDRVENYNHYQRKIGRLKWRNGLENIMADLSTRPLSEGGMRSDDYYSIINNIKGGIQSLNNDTLPYQQKRDIAQSISFYIKQFGGTKTDDLLKGYAAEMSKIYGNAYKTDFEKYAATAPENKWLDNEALLGYEYLKDIAPEKANQYKSLFIDPKKLKDDPDALSAYNKLMLNLKETGISLQRNAINEDLNGLARLSKSQDGLTPEQLQEAEKLEARLHTLDTFETTMNVEYPEREEDALDDATQEILGQKTGWASQIPLKTKYAIKNTVSGVWEIVSQPFMSDEGNQIRELSIMGEQAQQEKDTHKTDKNTAFQTSKMEFEPGLKKELEAVNNDATLDYGQKEDKIHSILRNNKDKWGRVEIANGKLNLSPAAIVGAVTDLGTTLVPFIAVEAATGGIGGAGTAARFLRTANAALLTGYHDHYTESLNKGLRGSDAYFHAMGMTAIDAAAMAGAGTAEAVRAFYKGKNISAAKVIDKLSDDAIEAQLKRGATKGMKAFGQSIKERAKATPGMIAKGAKTGANFEVAMAGAENLKGALNNEPVNHKEEAKRAVLGIINFSGIASIMGHAGYKSPHELDKAYLVDIGKQPEGYTAALEKMKNEGLSKDAYDEKLYIIERATEAYKSLPKYNSKGKQLTETQKGDYILQTIAKKEHDTNKANLPPKQAAEAELKSKTADYVRQIILDEPKDNELTVRLNKIEKALEPKKDTDGNAIEIPEKEKAELEAEKEAINQVMEERRRPTGEPEKITEPIELSTEPGKLTPEPSATTPTQQSKESEGVSGSALKDVNVDTVSKKIHEQGFDSLNEAEKTFAKENASKIDDALTKLRNQKGEVWNNRGTKFNKNEDGENTFVGKDGETYTISHTTNSKGTVSVKVRDKNGKTVSSAYFWHNGDGSYSIARGSKISSEIQGQGLAKAVYDYTDSNIGKIKKTETTTDNGETLWSKNSEYQPKSPTQYTEAAGVSGSALKDVEGKKADIERRNIKPSIDKKGIYNEKSIFRYFAKIFYGQRGGFNEFTKSELSKLSPETRAYLIRIYHQLKTLDDGYEIYDAEKILERDIKSGKSKYDITKSKTFNGKDAFYDAKTIVDTDEKRIQFARGFLSNDPSGRDNGITNGIASPTKVTSFEYPSQEVLRNLDEVFNGESAKYDAELAALEKQQSGKEAPTQYTEAETPISKKETTEQVVDDWSKDVESTKQALEQQRLKYNSNDDLFPKEPVDYAETDEYGDLLPLKDIHDISDDSIINSLQKTGKRAIEYKGVKVPISLDKYGNVYIGDKRESEIGKVLATSFDRSNKISKDDLIKIKNEISDAADRYNKNKGKPFYNVYDLRTKLLDKLKEKGIDYSTESANTGSQYIYVDGYGKVRIGDHNSDNRGASNRKEIMEGVYSEKELNDLINSITDRTDKNISESYHKAKEDGSNPELVKAVESLLSKEQPTPQQPTVSETKAEIKNETPQEPIKADELIPTEAEGNSKGEPAPAGSTAETGEGQPPIIDKDGNVSVDKEEIRGITLEANQQRREAIGMGEREVTKESFEQWDKEAESLLAKGYDINKLIDKMNRGEATTPVENSIRKIYAATLDKEVEANPTNEVLAQAKKYAEAEAKANAAAGRDLVSLKGNGTPRDSLKDFYVAKMEAIGTDTLTEAQKAEVKKQFDEVKKERDAYKAKYEEAERLFIEQQAKAELSKPSTQKTTTGKKDYKAERQSLKDRLKQEVEEYKAAGQKMGITSDGGKESFVISAKIAKTIAEIAKTHVAEVGVKIKEAVERTLEDVKEYFGESISDKDIMDVLAGKYNEKKQTKNELAAQMRELNTEAKLLQQYESLLKQEPQSESKKVEKNQRLKELRDEIKELQKEQGVGQYSEIEKAKRAIERNKAKEKKIREKIANKDYEPAPKPQKFWESPEFKKNHPKLYNEVLDSQVRMEEAQLEFERNLIADEMSRAGLVEKGKEVWRKTAGTVKHLFASFDFSGLGVQNLPMILTNPVIGAKGIKMSFADFASQKRFDRYLTELHNSADWKLMKDSGLRVSEPKSLLEEGREQLFPDRFKAIVKIKGKTYGYMKIGEGKYELLDISKPFERQFVSLGNSLRVIKFRTEAEKLLEKGYTFEKNPQEFEGLAKRINNLTSGADVPRAFQGELTNTFIWSTRLIAAKLNMLGISDLVALTPVGRKLGVEKGYYQSLGVKGQKISRQQLYAAADLAKFAASVMATTYLAAMAGGGTVNTDPTDDAFLDVKFKDGISKNYTGGFSKYIALVTQLIRQGKSKNGQFVPYSGIKDRGQQVTHFLAGKAPPITRAVESILIGKDYTGKETDLGAEANKLKYPMAAGQITEQIKKDGLEGLFEQGIETLIGINVKDERDYQSKDSKTPIQKKKAEMKKKKKEIRRSMGLKD